ncbi:DNA polymerase II [bacterium]|nr:DNA polymerase II [bacterium]
MKITDNHDKQQALDLTEDSRDLVWRDSFVGELFKGNFRWDLMNPYPAQSPDDKAIGDTVLAELEALLVKVIDPEAVDRNQEVPKAALKALGAAGFFGMKIPKEYGGMGLSVFNYTRAMALVGSYCGSTAVWLSAHQSIGVPQPLKLFGTKEQKEKYLPRLAKGAISAFALTEPDVGSDPARMTTSAILTPDKKHYIINGEKLYITNGPDAELLVVMVATPPAIVNGKEKKQITAIIVETNTPGFEVVSRCSFMGIRGIANGRLRFNNVKVPVDNVIGKPGEGLKIAFVTLNAGRLTIPAISAAAGKLSMVISKDWTTRRVQWGGPVGEHQAVQAKLAMITAETFAMDSIAMAAASLADKDNVDIRLEAAMAKYYGSERSWQVADELVQIRGGRGFETATSLKNRGEDPYPAERLLRDLRINRIIEGTSEIMQLFIAREAMDVHLKFIMGLMNPKLSIAKKIGIVGKMGLFYSWWYPKQWVRMPKMFGTRHLDYRSRCHLVYIQKTAKRLARELFHTMAKYQIKLEKEQLLLAQFVDIGTELFSMAASLSRAEFILSNEPNKASVLNVVDLICKRSKRRINGHFKAIRSNDNGLMSKVSDGLLKGDFDWMTSGIVAP